MAPAFFAYLFVDLRRIINLRQKASAETCTTCRIITQYFARAFEFF
jgi:hypothetical protein